MKDFIIFILAVPGLVWITNYSKLFKPIREFISKKYYKKSNSLLWFLVNIFGCEGCMGIYAGLACYTLQYYHLEIILYALIGSLSSLIFITFLNK